VSIVPVAFAVFLEISRKHGRNCDHFVPATLQSLTRAAYSPYLPRQPDPP
jgi:hypothetical protein